MSDRTSTARGVAEIARHAALFDPVGARDDPEHRHEILGAAHDRPARDEALHVVLRRRIAPGARHDTARRLVPEHAVEERRHPDRATDVRAEADRRCAGADDRAFTARAAAGRALRVVGVVGASADLVLLSNHMHSSEMFVTPSGMAPRRTQPSHDRRVCGRDDVASRPEPRRVGHSLERERLLDRARNAVERPGDRRDEATRSSRRRSRLRGAPRRSDRGRSR